MEVGSFIAICRALWAQQRTRLKAHSLPMKIIILMISLLYSSIAFAQDAQQIKVNAVKDYLKVNKEMSKLWTQRTENPNDLIKPVMAEHLKFQDQYASHRSIPIANHQTLGDFLDQAKVNVDYYVSTVGIAKSNTEGYIARYEGISDRVFDTLLSTLFLVADNGGGKLSIYITPDQRNDILDQIRTLYAKDFQRYETAPERPSYMWALYEMNSQLSGRGTFFKK